MTTIDALREFAVDKSNFRNTQTYIDFAYRYTDFVDDKLQATVIAQNNRKYQFFQYLQDGDFQITRPVNNELFIRSAAMGGEIESFKEALELVKDNEPGEVRHRRALKAVIYTLQQSIGCALDALPSGRSNQARKVNGDLFERLMLMILQETGFECTSGVTKIPVKDEVGVVQTTMNYQHDLILKYDNELKIIGSVKTSSKDRIDKIFIDKMLHNRLTGIDTPHIAIFLNDVQRKSARDGSYGISQTFLPGHFKGYTVSLNPLDGVYFCDILPNMLTDRLLSENISTIDNLFFDDLRPLLSRKGDPLDEVIIEEIAV